MSLDNANRWAKIADRDLALANEIFDTYPDSAAYHYQQAAEKYLKGFLAAHLVPLKKSHNISTLVLLAGQIDHEFIRLSVAVDLDVITSFATMYRYPNEEEQEFPTQAELLQSKSFCEQARDLVASRLQQIESTAILDKPNGAA